MGCLFTAVNPVLSILQFWHFFLDVETSTCLYIYFDKMIKIFSNMFYLFNKIIFKRYNILRA